MKKQENTFNVDEISQRIKVQKPYFAFQQLWQDKKTLIGSFVSEQPLVYESGPITAGELGRHLAILGSCAAAALHDGPEGYYLATKAHYSRRTPSQMSSVGERFYASAQVLNIDKHTLKISAQAWNKDPVAELLCEYTILSPALFQRNFHHYANGNQSVAAYSPYQHPIPLHNLVFQSDKLEALAGPLSPGQCAGHFSGYPCWPVAIISQTALQATGELLKKKYGPGTRFCVQDTQLSAEKLIGADNILKFSTEIVPAPAENALIKNIIRVYHGDEVIAHLSNQLELISAE